MNSGHAMNAEVFWLSILDLSSAYRAKRGATARCRRRWPPGPL